MFLKKISIAALLKISASEVQKSNLYMN